MSSSIVRLTDGQGEPLSVVVTGLAPEEYDALLAQHTSPGERYDAATFPPALVIRCLQVPGVRPRDVRAWFGDGEESWPADQLDVLLTACMAACGDVDEWRAVVDRLHSDAQLGLELDVCADYGIPHSTFLGWSLEDRGKALGHLVWKRNRCPGCGIPTESMQRREDAEVEARACVHCEDLATIRDHNKERVAKGGAYFHVSPTGGHL